MLLNTTVVWIVSIRPLISKSARPCTNRSVSQELQLLLVSPSLSCFIVFFNSLARLRYLSFFSVFLYFCFFVIFFNFTQWSARTAKSTIWLLFFVVFFCFFFIIRSARLVKIKRSICISKSQRNFCVSFSRTDAGLCIYHLFACPNFSFFHNSQLISLPTLPNLVLYSFCSNLQHSFIMRLLVSSVSPHYLHLLFIIIIIINHSFRVFHISVS